MHLRVATGEAVIPDRPRYTSWMHGQSFFDSVRYPWMEFVSDPYLPGLLQEGGPLKGRLSLRGVTRDEELRVLPAPCPQPGRDCDIQVVGAIERADYGMREWQFALTDQVRLEVRVRLRGGAELARWVAAPVSYFGQGSPYLHLGLAPSAIAELVVEPAYGGEPRVVPGDALVPDGQSLVDLAGR